MLPGERPPLLRRGRRAAGARVGLGPLGLVGAFDDATYPETNRDPDDFTDRYSFVNLRYEDDVLREGSAGWDGEQEDEDSVSSMAEYVLTFGAALQR